MNNHQFLDKAFSYSGPRFLNGFSRPVFHNLAGLLFGHRFGKRKYGAMMRYTEGAMLYLWARGLPPGSTIVEIGCYAGLSTSFLSLGASHNGSKIFSIDPFNSDLEKQAQLTDHQVGLENKPSRDDVYARLKAHGLHERVELIEGYSQEIVKDWNRPIDFLWIDGNHEQAYQDYCDWSPFLTDSARVAIHDAHPHYGLQLVADDARRIFSDDEQWHRLEHVKSILSAVRRPPHTRGAAA